MSNYALNDPHYANKFQQKCQQKFDRACEKAQSVLIVCYTATLRVTSAAAGDFNLSKSEITELYYTYGTYTVAIRNCSAYCVTASNHVRTIGGWSYLWAFCNGPSPMLE